MANLWERIARWFTHLPKNWSGATATAADTEFRRPQQVGWVSFWRWSMFRWTAFRHIGHKSKELGPCHVSTQSSVSVRAAEPGDYPRIAQLAGQLGYPCTRQQVESRFAEMQNSNEYATYVAQLPGGQIAGWIGVYVFRAVELDRCAEISGLIVDEQIRSRGVGSVLLHAAEQWARRRDCMSISVHSNVKRFQVHRFYEDHDYHEVKTQKVLQKVL